MKKLCMTLGISMCMCLTNIGVYAQEIVDVPISEVASEDYTGSIHQINMNAPITRAEFIIAIIQTIHEELPPIMDTHYALPAMQQAEELGLIDLETYQVGTWSQILSSQEKSAILSKAMNNSAIDMKKVYTALSKILVEHVEVNGKPVDLKGLPISHYNGKVMLPLRPTAEAMGFDIKWNKDTYTAILNNGKIESSVQAGFDSYNYSSVHGIGLSTPFSVGAAPRLIDGTLYVPADYFSMFANIDASNNTIHFLIK